MSDAADAVTAVTPPQPTITEPADPFALSGRFTIQVARHMFRNTHSYVSDVRQVGNLVSGGGTRQRTFHNDGYRVFVRNNETVAREYFFEATLYQNMEQGIVARRINARSIKLNPGEGSSIDIELSDEDARMPIRMTEIQVVDTGNRVVEKFSPHWDLAAMTAPSPKSKIVRNAVLLALVGFAAFSGFKVYQEESARSAAELRALAPQQHGPVATYTAPAEFTPSPPFVVYTEAQISPMHSFVFNKPIHLTLLPNSKRIGQTGELFAYATDGVYSAVPKIVYIPAEKVPH